MAFGNVGYLWLTISIALVDDETSVLRCLGPVVEGVGVPVGEDGQLGRVGGLGLLSRGAGHHTRGRGGGGAVRRARGGGGASHR